MEDRKTIFSVAEAAHFLGLRVSYLYQLTARRKIPFFKPNGGKVFFRREDLEGFVFRNRKSAAYETEVAK